MSSAFRETELTAINCSESFSRNAGAAQDSEASPVAHSFDWLC
ncbi:hypothetical protein RBWH47_01102 [Rhodopirellula baltica WH47]|uniref:Uncharacterized protein n=1 Tax=Rhodopirellula baltica WH47 TaxID=991778 RepID=F2ANY7_RHOBT|nr:hypothetical protein RBWH47_01102 [Rhodopirellula baltica WH47]